MAESTNLGMSIPPSKRPRVDSTASEGSEVINQLLSDLTDLTDLGLELNSNDSSNLINSSLNSTQLPIPQQPKQQNALNTKVAAGSQLQPTANHQGAVASVSPSATPPISGQASSGTASYSATPPLPQQPTSSNSTPNATINMYTNSPRGDVNSPRYANFNTSGNAPSPQPMTTLADPTPALPSVSSTPAHGGTSMATSTSFQTMDPNFSRASYMPMSTAPMITSSSSNVDVGGTMRGGAPLPPGTRMGMTTSYVQGVHPGVHGMQAGHSHGMGGQIQQQPGMLGPMRVGMPTQPHPGHHSMEGGQMGHPGMVTQNMHPSMRNQQYSAYQHGQPGVHSVQQQSQMAHRMMHNHIGQGMAHGGHVGVPMRPGMQMNPGMTVGGPQVMGGMRVPTQSHMQIRPVTNYNMAPGSQLRPQVDNRFSPSDQQSQMQGQLGLPNSNMGNQQRPMLANPNMPGVPGQMGPGVQQQPLQGGSVHQITQNDNHFGSQQNQGTLQSSMINTQPQSLPTQQPQGTLNAGLESAVGGMMSMNGSPGLSTGQSQQSSQQLHQTAMPQQGQGPQSINTSSQQGAINQPLNNRVPTPPPPGGNMALFPGKPMQGGPPNQTSDPEKRKQIQQQLVLLLHAHKCQRRERDQQASGDFRPCTLPHCKTMKSVLNHMTECQAGRTCTYAHCASSRQIITHWRNCQRSDCPVCLPLKQPSTQPQKRDQPDGSSSQPCASTGQFGIGMGPSTASVGQGGMNLNTPGMGFGVSGGASQTPGGNTGMEAANRMGVSGHMMADPNRAMYPSLGTGYPNPGSVSGLGSPSQSSFSLPIPNFPSTTTKQWHSQVNPDLRQHLVRKLVEAIYPVHDPTALRDSRVKSLIHYAMRVENVMFEAAQSREDYYKLLAQKIYLIRKELEDRKRNKGRTTTGQIPMVNGSDALHQPSMIYPGSLGNQQQSGQPNSGQSSSSPYCLPATPTSLNALSSNTTGIPSPRPSTADLPSAVPPTPIISIDTKKDIPNQLNKMMSPSYQAGLSSNPNSTDSFSQVGSVPSLPSSVKTDVKQEPLLSPTYPQSISAPPTSQIQIMTEINNAGMDSVGAVNVSGVPPLPDNLPSISNANTLTSGVASVKRPESIKRRESISSEVPPPSLKATTPVIPMDSDASRSSILNGKIVPDPSLKKVFSVDELELALRPVFDAVWNQDVESFPFRQPVNPTALGIPDYFEVIKDPMDLETINSKLLDGVYKSGWEFCSDMWLMFDNAWAYNKKTSRVYKYCSKLAEVFEQYINEAMVTLGYCCGMRHTYHPQVLYCYGKPLCTIPRDSPFYGCQNRYIYCPKCFVEIPGDTVTVGEDPMSATRVPKSQFKEMKNNAIDKEPMVECVHCGREMHQVCVLHLEQIWSGGFQCKSCLAALGRKRKDNKFVARRLPTTKLGAYLEDRVNGMLERNSTGAGHVTIRVVSSSDKTLDTRPLMRERFAGDFPPQFPYRTKAMFVFEEIDGVDVCFFGMHVQEYGSDCQAPNTRRVYISYLDSVHFFRPKQYRTQVYHEILIGYLEFCKQNGFLTAHIWACPPSEGDDYIFHSHPLEQKIPKHKRLSDWYGKMLETAKEANIICDFKDIYNHCTDEGITMVTDIPYFEGDFWPNIIEEIIKELDQEAKQREASELACSEGPKKVGKRGTNKKGSKKASAGRNKSSKKGSMAIGGDDLSSKVYQTMDKHKDVFFVVLLQPIPSGSSPLPGTTDPDQLISCDLMDGRDAFLTMSRERHWEFSSLRRAKFSSLSMVYELHTQSEDKFMYNCNNCHLDVVARYHCLECDDFDLCIKCYKEVGHRHSMVKQGLDIEDPQSNDTSKQDPQKARKASIEKCIRALVHATQCRDAHCKQPSCIKMKKVLTHTKECKQLSRKWNQCNICKQFVLLCISHAKNCTDDKCHVPLCAAIKKNLKEQRKQRAVQTNRFTQMRAARMMTSNMSASTPPSQTSPPTSSTGTTAAHISPPNSTANSTAVAVASPIAGPRSVGKGGPKTPATPGKGRLAVNPSVGGNYPGGSMLPQTGKVEQTVPSVPPNVTVSGSSRIPGEMEIHRIPSSGYSEDQLIMALYDPLKKETALQYLQANPALKERVSRRIQMDNSIPQDIMPYHPNPTVNSYPQPGGITHIRPTHVPNSMQANYGSSNYSHPQHHINRQQHYPGNHPQYMAHQVNPHRMQTPVQQPYQGMANQQQHPSTLQRMLTSGTPQQSYPAHQSFPSSMNPAHLGPPPQYPATAVRHPVPQTAGYPQVLGQQVRSMQVPSQMTSHLSPQMHAQYSGGGASGQGMGMDPMGGMQSSDQTSYMYQQRQFGLNSSNNNNTFSQGGYLPPDGNLSSLTPQDQLSIFVENL